MSAITDVAIAACLSTMLALPAVAADWPDVPAPEHSQSEWVSRHMVYNGVHMRSSRFTTARSPEQVEAFYREQWGADLVRNRLGRKTILGHREGRHFITVDLEGAGGGTEGTVGIVDMQAPPPRHPLGHGLPRPANSEVINDIRYLDTDSPARTLLLHNTLSPRLNHDYYFRRLSGDGWRHEGGGGCSATSTSCVARFARPGAHMAVTFNRTPSGRGTTVMINQVDE